MNTFMKRCRLEGTNLEANRRLLVGPLRSWTCWLGRPSGLPCLLCGGGGGGRRCVEGGGEGVWRGGEVCGGGG